MKLLRVFPTLAAFASSLALASAHTIEGKLTNLTTLQPGTRAVLTTYNEWVEHAPILPDLSFKFELIEPGEYLLRFDDIVHKYQWYHIQVPQLASAKPVVSLFNPGVGQIPGTIIPGWPMTVPAVGVLVYKNPVRTFNPIAFLTQNPLYLLLAFGIIITLAGPKLMETLDPEGYAEVSAKSAGSQQMISSLQSNDLAGSLSKYLAGSAPAAPALAEAGTTIASAPGALAGGEKVTGGASGAAVGSGGTPGKKGGKKRR